MNFENFSTGIDIEKIQRFEKYSKNKDAAFIKRIYTKAEIEYCFSFKNSAEHLAARFCGKEAVYKVLSDFDITDVHLIDIEILNNNKGVPKVKILSKNCDNFSFKISLTHTCDYAAASVLGYKKA